MKNFIFLTISFCVSMNAQNPAFYNVHPQNNQVEWYMQLNMDPVIIKHGTVMSETTSPNWYNAFQFDNCKGVFQNAQQAYSFLTQNSAFYNPNSYSYEDRNDTEAINNIFNSSKEALLRSQTFSLNEALKDHSAGFLSGCREQVIFSEFYLKYNGYEILLLNAMPMYLYNLESSSTTDIQSVINKITGIINDDMFRQFTSSGYYIKENGIWKATNFKLMGDYLQPLFDQVDFSENNRVKVHVLSTVDPNTQERIYVEN
ncbi:MAG: hypothetical protein WBG46_13705 [Nonlabens sp.]